MSEAQRKVPPSGYSETMPELPDITAYLTALEPRIQGQQLTKIRLPVFKVNPAIEQEQVERITKLRADRDASQWGKSIAELEA
jgi:formamidopyrimidine-DNA glycosylase